MAEEEESVKVGDKLAPFNPTSDYAIDKAIEFLNLSTEDVLYDLGCGDGRFLFRACEEVRKKRQCLLSPPLLCDLDRL